MKKTAVILSLIFCLLGFMAPQAEAQAVRSTNTVYKFNTTLTSVVDTVQITNTGTGNLYVKSWAGSADGVSLQFNVKKVSGDISGFRIYIYGSNNGVTYGSTAIDTIVISNTAAQSLMRLFIGRCSKDPVQVWQPLRMDLLSVRNKRGGLRPASKLSLSL